MQISEEMAILIFLGVVVLAIIIFFLDKAINKRKPHISAEAKVIKIDDRYSSHIYFGRRGGYSFSPRYEIKFQLKNGKKRTFACPSPDYKWVKLGDEGILTHQGTRFISFEKKID